MTDEILLEEEVPEIRLIDPIEIPVGQRYFDADQIGCHADGALGHVHLRARLAEILTTLGCHDELLESLRSDDWPDDLADEDLALEILQRNTEPGLAWALDAGDLVLGRGTS